MAKGDKNPGGEAKKGDAKPKPDSKAKAAGKPAGGARAKGAAAESEPAVSQGRPRSGGAKARLREQYAKSVVPALNKEFGYKNPMAVPKLEKVSINIGLGEASGNSKLMDGA